MIVYCKISPFKLQYVMMTSVSLWSYWQGHDLFSSSKHLTMTSLADTYWNRLHYLLFWGKLLPRQKYLCSVYESELLDNDPRLIVIIALVFLKLRGVNLKHNTSIHEQEYQEWPSGETASSPATRLALSPSLMRRARLPCGKEEEGQEASS